MEVYEITGFVTGVSRAGVNFLQMADSFQDIFNGYIYRQVLQSRQGAGYFAPRLANGTRVMGIFEHVLPNGEKKLLAFDTNNLYKYNPATGVFNLVPFGGSLLASGYAGFSISDKSAYISGTSYPTGDNVGRFVFCGSDISPAASTSKIFFYDDTSNTVKDFTNVADNPTYAGPLGGALTSATYVIYFGERLNFMRPVIGGTEFTQGILYSAIRTTSGNGDKFNIAGAGLLQADTYEDITGVIQLGQVLILNFERSNWTLEKTRDAFNPYFIRKVPSVLGTNAKFSAVSWNNTVRSIGRTGIISTDGRDSLRADNKIPYFTSDDIDQIEFNMTYGGFDRQNNQFLWSYVSSESESTTQDMVLVNNYEEDSWSVYDQRFSVFGQTNLGLNLTWDDIEAASGDESWSQWDTTEEIWDKIGLGLSEQKTLAGDDLGFIYDLNIDNDDYFTDISGAVPGTTTTFTVSESAFKVGDLVAVADVVGMEQPNTGSSINNFFPGQSNVNFSPYVVSSATATTVTIEEDSTLMTPYVSGGTISKVISFSARTIPFNPYRSQGRRVYVSHIEVLIDTNGGNLRVDVYEDEQEEPFKANCLLFPTITNQAREWITMSVDQESNFLTFVFRQESPSIQVKITSIRIHCEMGGYTSG